jgi:hypothetical protein
MLSYVARASLQLPEGTSGEGTKRWEEKDVRGGIEGKGKEWLTEEGETTVNVWQCHNTDSEKIYGRNDAK